MDATTTWKMLRRCRIDVYPGAPDYIHTNAGMNFNSEEFKMKATEMGRLVRIAPTEAHDRVGVIERSHATLKTVYGKLRLDMPTIRREERLSPTFRALNDVPNSSTGISLTTLVFGVYPKLPGSGIRGTMAERAHIIRQCTVMVVKMRNRRLIKDLIRSRNVPSVGEIEKVRNLPRSMKYWSTVKAGVGISTLLYEYTITKSTLSSRVDAFHPSQLTWYPHFTIKICATSLKPRST